MTGFFLYPLFYSGRNIVMTRPIKQAVLDENEPLSGLKFVSLVQSPAIQIEWIRMAADEPVKLAVQDSSKRIIFTPVLIPGQKIYRNIDGEEFDLVFDADTIEKIALKWQKDNLSKSVDVNHSESLIHGVTFFESVLQNNNRFALAKGFEKLPDGTWYLTGKVENDEVWAKIESGELTGVSIDGLFKTVDVKMAYIKMTEIKVANDNSLFVDGEIKVGNSVYYNRPEIVLINNQRSEMKCLVWEQQITLEDGTVLELQDGKIINIPSQKVDVTMFTDEDIKKIIPNILN